jgi:hypothetical protein
MKLGSPTELKLTPNADKTEVRFRLTFPEAPQLVEFSVSSESAMMIMHGLQVLQARHRTPIPARIRPQGKPVLQVVTDDE